MAATQSNGWHSAKWLQIRQMAWSQPKNQATGGRYNIAIYDLFIDRQRIFARQHFFTFFPYVLKMFSVRKKCHDFEENSDSVSRIMFFFSSPIKKLIYAKTSEKTFTLSHAFLQPLWPEIMCFQPLLCNPGFFSA